MGETKGLALILGRWLDRPGWGAVRRRVGGYLAEVRAEVTEPARLRLETPSGKLLAAVEYVEGETVFECANRTRPTKRSTMLCGTDLTPLDPSEEIGTAKVLVVVRRRTRNAIEHLIKHNKLGELRWAIARGHQWPDYTSWCAAKYGHLKLLQWALADGCGWDSLTSNAAAENNHLELLRWAIANGCKWHRDTSHHAAQHGHLELLRWAIANGCKWHPDTSSFTAMGGHLELLQWALANGCPDFGTRGVAVMHDRTEMVEWLDGREEAAGCV